MSLKGRHFLRELDFSPSEWRELLALTAELKAAAIKGGMVTLRTAGIGKVLDGVTTTEEILRVTMSD